ncbi:MAG: hypothetical protein JSV09_00185 [Thermoplasmata archaeon]|nr:MAG: hypothetical protein JSV09_00185 [Thermoplasmata archaeon]
MKVKGSLVILISLLLILNIIISTAIAGDEVNPEVDDETGEASEPGREFWDIAAAWIGDETNGTVSIFLKLAGPPPSLWDFSNEPDTTTYDYEVYFDVEGTNYAVSCSVQYAFVAGTIYTFDEVWNWQLRSVTYAAHTDIIQSEENLVAISDNDYDPQLVAMVWTVDKEDIGVGVDMAGRGVLLTNTWAAIWNTNDLPSDSQRDPMAGTEGGVADYAHTHFSNPGKNYRITGAGGVDYNIELSVDVDEKTTYGGTPVEFLVHAHNNGSDAFQITFFPGEHDETWSILLSPNSTTITVGATRTITVTVTPPKKVANGTVLVVIIEGNIQRLDGNGTVPVQPHLTLRIVALESQDEDEEGAWWENILDTLRENLAIIAGVIAIIVIAIIVLAVLIRR